jgi:UDP-2-acetamido-3-amino-2,3-dideoxy-glucuronate N-acetyltransferase
MSLNPSLPELASPNKAELSRIALVGFEAGLAQALGDRLVLIVEPEAEARAHARAAHPGVHVTALPEAALEPGAVDAVVFADARFLALAEAAAQAGITGLVVPQGPDAATRLRALGPRRPGVSPESSERAVAKQSERATGSASAAERRGNPPDSLPFSAGDAFIHPSAVVDGAVEIGAGTKVWHFCKLLGPLTIGEGCILGQNVVVERGVAIGRNVKIQNNVSVYSGVILEDDVFCGPSMVFTNVGTPRSAHPRRGQYVTTRVGQGASIGANATVVCGHTLGRYSFVGAGAVVTRDVPDYGLVYGNPARLRGWACFCGERLPMGVDISQNETAGCTACGRQYAREGHSVREVTG